MWYWHLSDPILHNPKVWNSNGNCFWCFILQSSGMWHLVVSLRPMLSLSKSCHLLLCCPTSLYPASLYCTTLWPILLCSICRCSRHCSLYSYIHFFSNHKFQNWLCIILLYTWSHRLCTDTCRSFISAASVHLASILFSTQFLKSTH
jgi:hypothetical protein